MPRIRTIKPTFFTSLTIADLTVEQRLTFIGLWTHVDDDGRCVYDPRLIKAAIWPLDDRSVAEVADDVRALTESSLITHYTISDRSYLMVNGWGEHQRINRPVHSKLPAVSEGEIRPLSSGNTHSVRTHPQLTESSLQERKGREGKGKTTLSENSDESDPFDEFWKLYPRKDAKVDARKAWKQVIKTTKPEAIIASVASYPFKPERQFQPLPASWLRGQRWEDEVGTLPMYDVSKLPAPGTGWAPEQLDMVLGKDAWAIPDAPEGMAEDEAWDWQQREIRKHRALRIQAANKAIGRDAA